MSVTFLVRLSHERYFPIPCYIPSTLMSHDRRDL
jgi:hypothetical protein